LNLDKQILVQRKIMDIRTNCIRKIIFVNGPFAYGDGGILKRLRWMKNLHHSTCDHAILYAYRSSEDEQVLIRPFLQEIKNTNMAGG
jgi:hypothetical protein